MVTAFHHDQPGTGAAAWRHHPRWADLPPAVDLARHDRLVVVAAHPDDESLGAAGLLATAYDAGLAVELVLLTHGEGSHPGSPTLGPDDLARTRRAEAAHALALLAPGAATTHLDVPDGAVAEHEQAVAEQLVRVVGAAEGRTLLVAPWRHDGHPDHEAAGRAAAAAAHRTDAALLEYPIWFWHWGDPHAASWGDLRALALPASVRERKQQAVAAHRTQVAPLSEQPGDEALLTPHVLEHFAGDSEVYLAVPPEDLSFEGLHAGGRDPWGARTRWYEERKRALLVAALPRPRFARALEVGSSAGELAASLAPRCDTLLAVDRSAAAVATARERLEGYDGVLVQRRDLPGEWPEGRFDLVVVSEVGYFLSPRALDDLVERVRGSLTEDGVVVLCHWRHPVAGWPLDGPDVHARFVAAGVRPEQARYADPDVELLVLTAPEQWPDPGE